MKEANQIKVVLVGCVALMFASCVLAKDWPQWRGPNRDGEVSGFAAIVSTGSAMLALPSSSELIVYKPDGKAYSEIAKYKVAETPTYAHPVIAGNRVFIKDQETVTMWVIE